MPVAIQRLRQGLRIVIVFRYKYGLRENGSPSTLSISPSPSILSTGLVASRAFTPLQVPTSPHKSPVLRDTVSHESPASASPTIFNGTTFSSPLQSTPRSDVPSHKHSPSPLHLGSGIAVVQPRADVSAEMAMPEDGELVESGMNTDPECESEEVWTERIE